MWDEIKNIKSNKKALREFGLTIGVILVILGTVALGRGKAAYPYLYITGASFIVLGLASPAILKPLQMAWMAVSIVIGFFMSRLLLSALFYGVVTPTGLVMKMLGKDILDERIEKGKASYWKLRSEEEKTKDSYEKQY